MQSTHMAGKPLGAAGQMDNVPFNIFVMKDRAHEDTMLMATSYGGKVLISQGRTK